MKTTLLLSIILLAAASAKSASIEKTLETPGAKSDSINYLLYLPSDYVADSKQEWPLLIFLHGAGERGDDLDAVKKWGPPRIIESGELLPMIVVAPQCPKGKWWDLDALDAMLSDLKQHYSINDNQIYLTGLSMGGYGTWNWAVRDPNQFAAIVPICGGGKVDKAAQLKDLPIWAFHGDKDKAVKPEKSVEMVDAVNAAGGNAKLTMYEGVGHNSWSNAYGDENLWIWLSEQKRED